MTTNLGIDYLDRSIGFAVLFAYRRVVIDRFYRACSAFSNLSATVGRIIHVSTPERSCIGSPERRCINDDGKKAPNWGPFRQASGLGGIIRQCIRVDTA